MGSEMCIRDRFQVRMETEIEFVGDWYFGEENEKLEMRNEENNV